MSEQEAPVSTGKVFITYATEDREIAEQLRIHLEGEAVGCWVDWQRLRPGDSLEEGLREALRASRGHVVLLTPRSVARHKEWIRKEIGWGLEQAAAGGFRLVPVLWGVEHDKLPDELKELSERLMVDTDDGARLGLAVREILFGLGLVDSPGIPPKPRHVSDLHELVLHFTEPRLVEETDEQGIKRTRVHGRLALELRAADGSSSGVGEHGDFRAPIGTLEADELRWYLESYYLWPAEAFQERAARLEARLPGVGRCPVEGCSRRPRRGESWWSSGWSRASARAAAAWSRCR